MSELDQAGHGVDVDPKDIRIAELEAEAAETMREWDILESACEFWHDTALELGYDE